MLNKQHTKRWLRWGFVKKHRWGFSGLETALVLLTWRGKALEWLLCNMLMVWVSTSQTLHDNCHQSTTCWLFPQSSPGMNESWKLNSPVPRLPLRAIPRRCLGNRRGKLALLFFFFHAVKHWSNKALFASTHARAAFVMSATWIHLHWKNNLKWNWAHYFT